MNLELRSAATLDDLDIVRGLLREYAAYLNESLGEEHICLSEYERELAALPGPYAQPQGIILLAFAEEKPAGCAALKPLKPERKVLEGEVACEMKRLWVTAKFRGHSIGLALAEELILYARRQGYTAVYLDTGPGAMKAANGLYKKLGFKRVQRYTANAILGANPSMAVEFFRLSLQDT